MDYLTSPITRASAAAWNPLVSVSRTLVLSLLHRIQTGTLKITDDTTKTETICGSSIRVAGAPYVELTVHNDAFWVRLLLFTDMGFSESYMLNEFSCSNLTAFFLLFIANKQNLSNGTTLTSSVTQTISNLARRTNTLSNARLNIAAHYDISNDMFAAFLSPDMTYSCPIWLPKSHPQSAEESLESAQRRKLQRFIDGACLKSTDRVLEIGTGWGSFAIQAVQQTGCRVTSLTLSVEQKELAEERIAAAGLSDKIQVLLRDYRKLEVPPEGPYDKFVSIEMLEAVGREFLPTYFQCVDRLLKKEGGIAVFQCITMPEPRYEAYHATTDFIRSYIFPGGHLPSISGLVSACTAASQGTLILESLENIGPHYAKTLRLWGEAFAANFHSKIKPSLLQRAAVEGKAMTQKDVDTFFRKWMYYFAYCEAGFATCTLGDVIFKVSREGTIENAEQVPL